MKTLRIGSISPRPRSAKTPQGWRAEGAFNTASHSANHTPIRTRLKALLIGISTHDAALIALAVIFAAVPLLAVWRALP